MKKCSKCKIIKSKSEFSKQSCKADGLRYHCKECRKAHQQKFYLNNKNEILAKNKEYYYANRDEIQTKNKIYYDNRYNNDINFKLAHLLRVRLNEAIKNDQKAGSAVKDLGCSIEELKVYLESKFQEGMTWDNHTINGWHIDHIRPLCSFNLEDEEELKSACHYTNLQPLWYNDNIAKGGKYE